MLDERARERREARQWICPGPEWPPDDETCGRVLGHPGRCQECMRRRTLHRKEAARTRRRTLGRRAAAERRTA